MRSIFRRRRKKHLSRWPKRNAARQSLPRSSSHGLTETPDCDAASSNHSEGGSRDRTADAWWRENRLSVPGAVREDLKGAFDLLLQRPAWGTQVVTARLPGTRRLYLKRISYFLYYRVQGDDLFVLGLALEPRTWAEHLLGGTQKRACLLLPCNSRTPHRLPGPGRRVGGRWLGPGESGFDDGLENRPGERGGSV